MAGAISWFENFLYHISTDSFEGVQFLKPLATWSGLRVDEINFVAVMLWMLIGAGVMKKWLAAGTSSSFSRDLYCGITGFGMVLLCFGLSAIHLLILSSSCYLLMCIISPKHSHIVIFIYALSYLSGFHIYRMLIDYGSYTLDLTTPMMMMVARITSLAFNYYDGKGKSEDKLLESQKESKVVQLPSFNNYFSYVFAFNSVLFGPFMFYFEHRNFINGLPLRKEYAISDEVKKLHPEPPSVASAVIPRFILFLANVVGYLYISPRWPIAHLLDQQFIGAVSWIKKILYLLVSSSFLRCKYYIAWLCADVTGNLAGIGFSGYDEQGNPKWDANYNVALWDVEMSTNPRQCMNAWNIGVTHWLRTTVYERSPIAPTLLTYVLSAFWHGFYPGYFFTFISAALMISSARWGRRKIRPIFQANTLSQKFYDVLTFGLTRICMAYLALPFVFLDIGPAHKFYMSVGYFGHILLILGIVILPFVPSPKKIDSTNKKEN